MSASVLNFFPPCADTKGMSGITRSLPSVWLDGRPVALATPDAASLATILAELETLAASQQRVLAGVWVDGQAIVPTTVTNALQQMERVEAETISLAELGRRLAEETRRQVRELRWQMERAIVVVLINEPAMNRKVWHGWQHAMREPLANLGLLRDLWGARLGELTIGGHSLEAHLEEFGRIAGHVELVLLKPDGETLPSALVLSDVIERSLVPWLRRLEDYLGKLHEQTWE